MSQSPDEPSQSQALHPGSDKGKQLPEPEETEITMSQRTKHSGFKWYSRILKTAWHIRQDEKGKGLQPLEKELSGENKGLKPLA